jgi:hypothetical protein
VSTEFYLVAFAATLIISASRFTRLATVDKFPPVKAIRDWYENRTDGSGWQWLTLCGYCFSFWATFPLVAWAYFAGVLNPIGVGPAAAEVWTQVWWLVNGTFAASYLAAVFMAHDGATGEDD